MFCPKGLFVDKMRECEMRESERERFLDWYLSTSVQSIIYKLTVFLHWFIKVRMFLIQSTTNFLADQSNHDFDPQTTCSPFRRLLHAIQHSLLKTECLK